jgi:hypothetical protein
MRGIYNLAVEMGSGAVPSFIKIGSGIQKLIGGTDSNVISYDYVYFLKNKESRLKKY